MDSEKIVIYCDGSCLNPRGDRTYGIKGGYGVFISWRGKVKRIAGGRFDYTSNNRMELMAMITSLKEIKKKRGYKIEIISDSKYVIDSIIEGWVFSWEEMNFIGKKNEDLWREFLAEYRKFRKKDLTFTWTRGHVGTIGNEEADRLAGIGANKEKITIDYGSGLYDK
jgi:ribonuclease HI